MTLLSRVMGERQVLGVDGPKNIALGIMNVTDAAHLGSDHGAFLLGKWMFYGRHGLPKDPARARFWLKKVVDGPFSLSLWPLPARRLLEELDSAGD